MKQHSRCARSLARSLELFVSSTNIFCGQVGVLNEMVNVLVLLLEVGHQG